MPESIASPIIRLRLPWPPSDNHMYKPNGRGGRLLTDEAKMFRWEVKAAAMRARIRQARGRLAISVSAHEPQLRRVRDITNSWKCLNDALKIAGVIVDDQQFDHAEITRADPSDKPEGHIVVHITRFEPPPPVGGLFLEGA